MTTFLFFMTLSYLILKLSKNKKTKSLLKKWDEIVQEGIADIQKANQQAYKDIEIREGTLERRMQEIQEKSRDIANKSSEIEDTIIISEEKQQAKPSATIRINLESIREKKQDALNKQTQEIEDAVILNEIKANRKPPDKEKLRIKLPESKKPTVKETIAELKIKLQPEPKKSTAQEKVHQIITEQRQNSQRIDFVDQLKKELGLIETNSKTEQPKEWTLELLLSLEWKRFEEVCREYIKIHGCDARLTKNGADGGIDIELYDNDKLYGLVQCKAWITKVGVKEIRELYGIMASRKITDGTFFTTSSYTQEAFIFAQENQIDLYDGNSLINGIKNLSKNQQEKLLIFATSGDYTTPTCARCNLKMIKRISSQGKHFWGCINFPRCKSTLQIRKAV